MGDDLFTMPDDSMNFGNDPGFNLGDQPLMPMIPQDPSTLYDPMLPFNPQDPGYDLGLGAGGAAGRSRSSGNGSSGLSSLMRLFGVGGSGSDAAGLMTLLSMLGAVGGGLLSRNAIGNATNQMTGAINDANNRITGILGDASTRYAPYAALGQQGAAALAAMPNSNIAAGFRPLGTGRGIVGAPNSLTLGQLAGR